uniref:Uncharacterized protein n=1 Tax=Sinocyclocheilus anshuiensis TaxID=1608454 RepID=A0A671SZB6_9TELE
MLEDCNADYQDDLKRELNNAVTTMKISPSKLCFIILCCKRSLDPERMSESLKLKFEPEFILTFVLMSEEFEQSYITGFVENLLKEIDHSSLQTQLIKFVALLNSHIENSYLSIFHCEAFLVRHQIFENSLSDETNISSVRIIHNLIAKEMLKQLSSYQSQSEIAMSLLQDKVLFDHRFRSNEFQKFVRDLFIKRTKKSKGDPNHSWFSPLIEHVREAEVVEKAIDLLKVAYTRFDEDAFVAQQLARLLYENNNFEEAEIWAKRAKSRLPQHTYILDTLGQVYKKWFYSKHDAICEKNIEIQPEDITDIIDTALKGITTFRESEKCPQSQMVCLNNSYFGEIDIGCRLLELLSNVNIFSTKEGNRELMEYLLTDYIPKEVQKPWQKFHGLLKRIINGIRTALKCISDELAHKLKFSNLEAVTLQQSFTFSPITINKELIISLFPADLQKDLNQTELKNFIFCQIALSCASPGSGKLLSIEELQNLSRPFCSEKRTALPDTAYLLLSLLFWPEDSMGKEHSNTRSDVVTNAIKALHRYSEIKSAASRKGRIFTHFFLRKTRGLNKIVHKTTIEKFCKGTLSERRLKCNIRVIPLFSASLPNSNENVTFYLGFSLRGVVAFVIKVAE